MRDADLLMTTGVFDALARDIRGLRLDKRISWSVSKGTGRSVMVWRTYRDSGYHPGIGVHFVRYTQCMPLQYRVF